MERPSNTTLALLGGLGILLLLLVYFAVARSGEQDVLRDSATFSAENPDLNKACAGQSLYEQIKRALFRQAGQLRAKDGDAYGQIAAAAAVRMENPAAEGENREQGLVDCAGSLAIDLPPGVATVAGRRQLMSDIYYSVVPAAAGPGKVVQLRGADTLVKELAGLTVQAAPALPSPMPSAPIAAPPDPLAAEPAPPIASDPAGARPSFDCARARSPSERAVCADPQLAGLDRSMSSEYARAMASATPQQQALLRQTRDRFLAYRDSCPNAACIGAAYSDRIREIRDIMAGRWSPGR